MGQIGTATFMADDGEFVVMPVKEQCRRAVQPVADTGDIAVHKDIAARQRQRIFGIKGVIPRATCFGARQLLFDHIRKAFVFRPVENLGVAEQFLLPP